MVSMEKMEESAHCDGGSGFQRKEGTKLFRFAAFWSWSFVRVEKAASGNGFTSFVGVL